MGSVSAMSSPLETNSQPILVAPKPQKATRSTILGFMATLKTSQAENTRKKDLLSLAVKTEKEEGLERIEAMMIKAKSVFREYHADILLIGPGPIFTWNS